MFLLLLVFLCFFFMISRRYSESVFPQGQRSGRPRVGCRALKMFLRKNGRWVTFPFKRRHNIALVFSLICLTLPIHPRYRIRSGGGFCRRIPRPFSLG